jgi:nicotinamide-nucleotide amidase
MLIELARGPQPPVKPRTAVSAARLRVARSPRRTAVKRRRAAPPLKPKPDKG